MSMDSSSTPRLCISEETPESWLLGERPPAQHPQEEEHWHTKVPSVRNSAPFSRNGLGTFQSSACTKVVLPGLWESGCVLFLEEFLKITLGGVCTCPSPFYLPCKCLTRRINLYMFCTNINVLILNWSSLSSIPGPQRSIGNNVIQTNNDVILCLFAKWTIQI